MRVLPLALVALLSGCAVRLSPPSSSNMEYLHRGSAINYEVHGSGETTLVLLHGFGASLETWRDVEPLLAGRYKLYMVDLKGFGRSAKPDDNRYSADDQAGIILGFLEEVVQGKAVLVGNSFGGAVALKTYLGSRKTGLANVGGLVLIDAAAYRQSLPMYIRVLTWPLINKAVFLLSASSRARTILKKAFFDDRKVTDERVRRHAQFLDLPGAHQALIKTAKQMIPADIENFEQQIKTIDVPTLVIWGKADEIIPPANAMRLASDIRNARYVLLSDAGHAPQEETAGRTADAIIDFLSN